ncbi:MAG: prepilin peptidase [bacterium]|nr:prepilin peptidase [bacterium]
MEFWFGSVVFFVFGAIVGSFLNVLIIRLHTGRSATGRSGCMSCEAPLNPLQLVPVFSYFYLRGRCARCGCAISLQYPLVELATALLFVLVWSEVLPVTHTLILLAIVSTLILIVAYDLRHTIIPDEAVYVFITLAFLWGVLDVLGSSFPETAFGIFAVVVGGLAIAFPLWVLWAVSHGAWMGFGDIKLALGIGLMLGIYGGLQALLLAFVLGAVVGGALMYVPGMLARVVQTAPLSIPRARFTMKSEIPFAPFLLAGFLLVLFFDIDVIALLTFI